MEAVTAIWKWSRKQRIASDPAVLPTHNSRQAANVGQHLRTTSGRSNNDVINDSTTERSPKADCRQLLWSICCRRVTTQHTRVPLPRGPDCRHRSATDNTVSIDGEIRQFGNDSCAFRRASFVSETAFDGRIKARVRKAAVVSVIVSLHAFAEFNRFGLGE